LKFQATKLKFVDRSVRELQLFFDFVAHFFSVIAILTRSLLFLSEFQYGPRGDQQAYLGQVSYSRSQVDMPPPRPAKPPPKVSGDPPPYSMIDQYQPTQKPVVFVARPEAPLANQRASLQASSPVMSMPPPLLPEYSSGSASPAPPLIPPLPQTHFSKESGNPFDDFAELSASLVPPTAGVAQNIGQNRSEFSPFPENPSDSSRRTIDFDLELPRITQAIKDKKDPAFLHFNKLLNKNKPLSDIRSDLVNSKYLSDLIFHVNGQKIYAHKALLITSSFLFYDKFHVKGETQMTVKGIDLETFMKILTYCYTDKIQVTEEDVLELLLAGNVLQVRQITNVCNGFISKLMNPVTIFTIFDKALEVNNEVFQKKCIDFINKNEEKCFSSKGFFQVSLSSLMKMLEVCNYQHGKISEIVEKYTNGSMGLVDEETAELELDSNANVKETGAVKKPKKAQEAKKKIHGSMGSLNGSMGNLHDSMQNLHESTPNTKGTKSNPKGTKPSKQYPKPPHQNPRDFMQGQQEGNPQCFVQNLQGSMTNPQHPNQRPQKSKQNPPNINQKPPNPNQKQRQNQKPNIPDLMSMPIPNPLHVPHRFPPPFNQSQPFNQPPPSLLHQQFKPSPAMGQLVTVDDDDDHVIVKDNESTRIYVVGSRHNVVTEVSRLDFVCQRSLLIHEIGFSEDLSTSSKEIRVKISVFEQNKWSDIHNRVINSVAKPSE
jgi:hypothetical protein